MGHYEDALADIAEAVEINPTDYSNLWWISPSLVATSPDRQFRDGVLQLADRAVDLNEGSTESLATRAAIHIALGESVNAATDLDSIMESRPDDSQISASVNTLNRLAWALVTPADTDVVTATSAVAIATKATEIDPDNSSCWNTLGTAQYRAEEFKEAIKSLSKSLEMSERARSYRAIFLAMAHWQLDEQTEARRWYAKSLEWADEATSKDDRFHQFKAEAEAMGIDGLSARR